MRLKAFLILSTVSRRFWVTIMSRDRSLLHYAFGSTLPLDAFTREAANVADLLEDQKPTNKTNKRLIRLMRVLNILLHLQALVSFSNQLRT